MKKVNKTYIEDGVKYQFSSDRLMMYINQRKAFLQKTKKKATQISIREELAEKACVSQDAVKNWMYGNNAPSDLEQVKILAEYFEVDYHQLLKMEEEKMAATMNVETTNKPVNEAQQIYTKTVVRELYRQILALIRKIGYYAFELELEEGTVEEYFVEEHLNAVSDAYEDMHEDLLSTNRYLEDIMIDVSEKFYKEIKDYLWSRLDTEIELVADPSVTESDVEVGYIFDMQYEIREDYARREHMDALRELFAEYIP